MIIALVAGETSGDLLGSQLIDRLKQRHPEARFVGIGGDRMKASGMDCWHHTDDLSVMGLFEVLRDLPRLLKLRKSLTQRLLETRPDCFVGIDAPDFNLGLEKTLKQNGIRTVHYVSPSVWAWRPERARKIGDSCDLLLALFPFEPEFYRDYDVNTRYIGHPLADVYTLDPDTSACRDHLLLDRDRPVISILPGSRKAEVKRLSADFLLAAQIIHQDRPEIQFVLPAASLSLYHMLKPLLRKYNVPVRLILKQSREAMTAADVIVLASGTATLEAMLCKKPMVVGYKLSPMTHFIVRQLGMLKIEHYSLPNVLAGRELIPEMMQHDLNAADLAETVLKWLDDPDRRHQLADDFRDIHLELKQDAASSAAEAISQLMQGEDNAPA